MTTCYYRFNLNRMVNNIMNIDSNTKYYWLMVREDGQWFPECGYMTKSEAVIDRYHETANRKAKDVKIVTSTYYADPVELAKTL